MKGHMLFMLGSGGTGKTAVAKYLEERKNLGFKRIESPTRAFYAMEGIKSEIELMALSGTERSEFHKRLRRYYMAHLRQIASTEKGNLIVERSLIDPMAYSIFHEPTLKVSEITKMVDWTAEALREIEPEWGMSFGYFPYPTSWILDGGGDDGFRSLSGGKDTIVQGLMTVLLRQVIERIDIPIFEVEEDTLEARGYAIVNNLNMLAAAKFAK